MFGTRNETSDEGREGQDNKGESPQDLKGNETDKKRSERDSDQEEPKAKGFNETYWAQMMISAVAHEYNASWDYVTNNLTAIEFLNIYQFIIERKKRELEMQKQSLSRIKHRY